MKAFLLAAGEGRRLRPLTNRIPKCLVPIAGTPLLGIWLQLLESQGFRGVLVNTHYLAGEVEAFLRSWRTSMELLSVHEPTLLGSAGTVLANRSFVDGEQQFAVIYADNLSNLDMRAMVHFHATRPEPLTIGIVPTDRPQEKGTVVVDEQKRIVAFDEKVARPRSNLSNAGVYVASRELFNDLDALKGPEVLDFGFHVLPSLVPRIAAYPIHEFMMDIGTLAAYAEAQVAWPAAQGVRARGGPAGTGNAR